MLEVHEWRSDYKLGNSFTGLYNYVEQIRIFPAVLGPQAAAGMTEK